MALGARQDALNIQPGEYGRYMLKHHQDAQILDLLHVAELGLPKIPWKHGILNNASDDARLQIAEQLREWKHPLDTRRKDDNRNRAAKWFTGKAWASFCAGLRGSPGGPRAIAELVLIVANDLSKRGVVSGALRAGETARQAATEPTPKRKSGEAGLANRVAAQQQKHVYVASLASESGAGDAIPARTAQVKHIPSAMEVAADPARTLSAHPTCVRLTSTDSHQRSSRL